MVYNMTDESEPEMMRHQMRVRRAALAEKLETLERKIVDTVRDARDGVREAIRDTREAVVETVQTVKDSVHSSVDSVKETLNVPRQVDRNPWTMFGGAVAVGFVAGCLLDRAPANRISAQPSGSSPSTPSPGASVTGLTGNGRRAMPTAAAAPASPEESWVNQLARTFAPEIQRLKGMAIGVVAGVARDMVKESVPETMRQQVGEMMDNIATKMGGATVQSDVLEQFFPPRHGENPNGHARPAQEEFHG
jgi:ElaB/YqjD/DUF883 family membrane-anchored ribosome-binding protein